jgi:hypothetical protein
VREIQASSKRKKKEEETSQAGSVLLWAWVGASRIQVNNINWTKNKRLTA